LFAKPAVIVKSQKIQSWSSTLNGYDAFARHSPRRTSFGQAEQAGQSKIVGDTPAPTVFRGRRGDRHYSGKSSGTIALY
jgi:hypothetical protein